MSYADVIIPDLPGTLLYADPPYFGTDSAVYRHGTKTFDYDQFYNWCSESNFPVYISGYDMPKNFIPVCEIPVHVSIAPHRQAQGTRTRLPKLEKLFWNGKY